MNKDAPTFQLPNYPITKFLRVSVSPCLRGELGFSRGQIPPCLRGERDFSRAQIPPCLRGRFVFKAQFPPRLRVSVVLVQMLMPVTPPQRSCKGWS